jgi:hypothetical protein
MLFRLPQRIQSLSSNNFNWRETIPESWEKDVTNIEYWEQSRFCAELIVEQAGLMWVLETVEANSST